MVVGVGDAGDVVDGLVDFGVKFVKFVIKGVERMVEVAGMGLVGGFGNSGVGVGGRDVGLGDFGDVEGREGVVAVVDDVFVLVVVFGEFRVGGLFTVD